MKTTVSLKEYKTYSADIFWNPISKGLENLKKSLKLSVKDIWGSVKYLYDISTETDEEKIAQLKTNRNDVLNTMAGEYKSLWGSIVQTNPDFAIWALLAAPGPYLLANLTLTGRANLNQLQNFCKDAGIPAETLDKLLGNPMESPESVENVKRMMIS